MNDTNNSDTVPSSDDLEAGGGGNERSTSMSEVREGFDATKIAVVSGGIVLALLAIFSVASGLGSSAPEEEEEATRPVAEANLDPDQFVAAELTSASVPPIDPDEVPVSTGDATGPTQPPAKTERQIIAESARRSSIMAFSTDNGFAGAATDPRRALTLASQDGGTDAQSGTGDTELDRLRQPSRIGTSRARNLGDRNYLITAGTFIPCTLQTAILTSQPGFVTCIIPNDVYSDNGRVVLMEKGTRVFGEYQTGVQQGQARLFILWTRATTPRGIAIALGSPATGPLGRAGVDGKIDNFFWQRFGAALLFSLVDNAALAAQNQIGNQGNNITQVPSRVPERIIEQTINIPPALVKNQGESVGILVAQDFDFSDIYNLRLRRP